MSTDSSAVSEMHVDEAGPANLWALLPRLALSRIFQELNYQELVSVGAVCRSWYHASREESLWKRLFHEHFSIDKNVPIVPAKLWYSEFRRLCYHIPMLQSETLLEHNNEVLHVSFSHNGRYFSTCSKDGSVLVWNSAYPANIRYQRDMKAFSWKYTQYSQFNESDTLLLVSGVHFGTPHSTSGEIAVFNLQNGFQLQCRVLSKPYDIFGTWYGDQHLLSGDLHWLAHLVSTSVLWLNKASQETESEHVPITKTMYRFYNRNASSIRAIMVANCLPNSETLAESSEAGCESDKKRNTVATRGNPVSHRDIDNLNGVFNQIPTTSYATAKGFEDFDTHILYSPDYRKVEAQGSSSDSDYDDSDDDHSARGDDETEEVKDCEVEEDTSETSQETSNNEESDVVVQTDKYLIFTTGIKTYTPHLIGFKRIKPFAFPKRLDPGLTLRERLILRDQRRERMRSSSPPVEPNWQDYDAVSDKFDKIDHYIDLHGHIIGMGLSPDHRYLYVNSRPWPKGYTITHPLDPPPIAQEIDIHVIDLVTLKQVGTMLRSHRAYTPNNECFFIFLDVCKEYVASGAEDKHGYLWDRHYGMCLAKYPHANVVNSVAFNPKDPEMLVTTSDDYSIKVWRSRSKVRELGLNESRFQRGVEVRRRRRNRSCSMTRWKNLTQN